MVRLEPAALIADGGARFTLDSSATGLLGQGGQGVVRVATRDADGVYVAIKTGDVRELRLEVTALSLARPRSTLVVCCCLFHGRF